MPYPKPRKPIPIASDPLLGGPAQMVLVLCHTRQADFYVGSVMAGSTDDAVRKALQQYREDGNGPELTPETVLRIAPFDKDESWLVKLRQVNLNLLLSRAASS